MQNAQAHPGLEVRLRVLERGLSVDRAWSLPMVQRELALGEAEVRAAGMVVRLLSLPVSVHRDRRFMHTPVVSLSPLRKLSLGQIAHLVGTASMRLDLQAAPEDWVSTAQAQGRGREPDAIWSEEGARRAIEYDSGMYAAETIRRKLSDFGRYDHLYWGVPTAKRVEFVQSFAGPFTRLTVFRVDWFQPVAAPPS